MVPSANQRRASHGKTRRLDPRPRGRPAGRVPKSSGAWATNQVRACSYRGWRRKRRTVAIAGPRVCSTIASYAILEAAGYFGLLPSAMRGVKHAPPMCVDLFALLPLPMVWWGGGGEGRIPLTFYKVVQDFRGAKDAILREARHISQSAFELHCSRRRFRVLFDGHGIASETVWHLFVFEL